MDIWVDIDELYPVITKIYTAEEAVTTKITVSDNFNIEAFNKTFQDFMEAQAELTKLLNLVYTG
jgi:hypothetical protein